ncbi:MAG: 30S ribosomal protein S12 methylthiotransferase RimO [Magnetococcales bacterium]|nr:30S ribosomal protein S12 methylthiotransferase RimO [Magnetococcales bacterium]
MQPKSNAPTLVGVISLGCPKNLVDTEHLLGQFRASGYLLTGNPEEADILVVNTCGFKADAEAESWEAIREMAGIKAASPGGKRLVVTGCLAERRRELLCQEIPEIDILLGTGQYDRLLPLLDRRPTPSSAPAEVMLAPPREVEPHWHERVLTTLPHTAYVKIAEGCNNPCAFCIIPALRGPFRSRAPDRILEEVRILANQGVLEINLVSQDTSLYGRDLTPRIDLAHLLERLRGVEYLEWIRLLYLYPTLVTDRLLEVIAEGGVVLPYFDIPLQHSHSAVLQRMRRAERTDDINRLLERIRKRVPEAVLRTTFIVGFPGESEAEFAHLLRFVEETGFDHVGVFTYSDEPECAAHALPDKIPPEIALERQERLMALQQGISRRKLASRVGQTFPVLVERTTPESPWVMIGRTTGQAPEIDGQVYITRGNPPPGQILPVTITESHEYDLVGVVAAL